MSEQAVQFADGDVIEPTAQMYEEAAGWILRLRETRDEAEVAAFQAWRAAAPAHGFALAEMETLFAAVAAPAAELAVRDGKARGLRRRWVGLGLAAGLALTLWGVAARDDIAVRLRADETAAVGGQRAVTLPDGTHVALNTRSALQRRYTAAQRGVRLLRGEAFFDVAKDAARPFVIEAGAARITVVGTHFNVRLDRDDTVVTVEEGVVRLSPLSGRGELRLSAGQQGFVEGAAVQAQPNFDPLAVSAWRRGQVVFYDARLDRVTAELNRYRAAPIVVLNPTLGAERISGVFALSDTDDAIKSLEKRVEAKSLHLPGGVMVLY